LLEHLKERLAVDLMVNFFLWAKLKAGPSTKEKLMNCRISLSYNSISIFLCNNLFAPYSSFILRTTVPHN